MSGPAPPTALALPDGEAFRAAHREPAPDRREAVASPERFEALPTVNPRVLSLAATLFGLGFLPYEFLTLLGGSLGGVFRILIGAINFVLGLWSFIALSRAAVTMVFHEDRVQVATRGAAEVLGRSEVVSIEPEEKTIAGHWFSIATKDGRSIRFGPLRDDEAARFVRMSRRFAYGPGSSLSAL
jgi:hypothetical protein